MFCVQYESLEIKYIYNRYADFLLVVLVGLLVALFAFFLLESRLLI